MATVIQVQVPFTGDDTVFRLQATTHGAADAV
jgi:hypothetical protein